MTDEEKAEEYINKRPFIHLLGRNTFFIQKEFRDAILWALAEGRKETAEKISELEKENEELKSRVESLICNLMDIQNKVDEIVTIPKITQKEENELLCKLIKRICEYTRSN